MGVLGYDDTAGIEVDVLSWGGYVCNGGNDVVGWYIRRKDLLWR